VCVSNFALGKYEVTQGQWRKIMGNNPSYNKKCGDNCPVEKVSWKDSQKFIKSLNRLTGYGFRLPTEAEWEFACRSGKLREKYCGSDNVDAVAWYSDNSEYKTHPVGGKQPNALGIYDMSGNVWEWVNDWYGDYPSDIHNNPQGPSSASHRLDRGGSYRSAERFVQSARRASNTPGDRVTDLGLRLASSVE